MAVAISIVTLLSYKIAYTQILEKEIKYQKASLNHFMQSIQMVLNNSYGVAYKQVLSDENMFVFSQEYMDTITDRRKTKKRLDNAIVNDSIYDFLLTDYKTYVYAARAPCGSIENSIYKEFIDNIGNKENTWLYHEITSYEYSVDKKQDVKILANEILTVQRDYGGIICIDVENMALELEKYVMPNYDYYILGDDFYLEIIDENYGETSLLNDIRKYSSNDFTSEILISGDNEYNVYIIKSNEMNWSYVSIISTGILFEEAHQIRKIGLIIAILGMSLGLLMSFIISNNLYKPIRMIVNNIYKYNPTLFKNEMSYIDKSFIQLIESNESSQKVIENNKENVEKTIIRNALRGDINYEEYKFNKYVLYQVAVIVFKDIGEIYNKKFAILENNEYYNLDYNIFEMAERVVILFKLKNKTKGKDEEKHCLDNLLYTINNNYSIKCVIGIGKYVNQPENIKYSYSQSLDSCTFKTIKGWNCIINYSDINISISNNDNISYDINQNYVMELFAQKNIDDLMVYFTDMLNIYGSVTRHNDKILYSIYYQIIAYLNSYMFNNKIYEDISIHVPDIMNVDTIDEMKENINNLLYKIISYLCTQQNAIIQKVSKYIDDNYYKDLSLSHVAEVMHFNSSYLSRKFKMYHNATFSSYLINVRMKNASKLLIDTNDNIITIANKVGYHNISSFNKCFRKVYGCSPSAYRNRRNCSALL